MFRVIRGSFLDDIKAIHETTRIHSNGLVDNPRRVGLFCVTRLAGISGHLPPQTGSPKNRMSVPKENSVADADKVLPASDNPTVRVLLAEDDRALRRFLEVVLQRAGYEVIPAADGLEAMKIALSSNIDIVVTDAMMPNLSGHEFCRFLRNSQTLSHLPVILLSALERKETNQDSAHVDAFLAKPVSGEGLIECIESLLAKRKEKH